MPLYVALGKVTPVGAADLKGSRERFEENRKAFEAYGARVISGYAVMGSYDFLFIIEAPDNDTAMRLSTVTASRGTSLYETMPIVPIEEFLRMTDELEEGRAGV
jgi:uncharacterized protein with GYD domain